ncbi:head GIN domain-containing protein [Pontibacter kalidii]|uniref:head GIN domain-containing protein n=1 Tax=Pontibacter kalidii TaxID=2592049 RepID=UPI0022561A3E|nr:head GIN domain-containing protein [Pontibacter kalidii]
MDYEGRSVLFALMSAGTLSACEDNNCIKGEGDLETRTLNLQPFSRVEANGDFKVYITQGETQLVEVRGEPNILDQLETSISNNTWEIEHRDCVRRSKTVEVYITMPQVQSLYLNGSGRIVSQDEFTANELAVEINGSGKIDFDVVAAKVIARVTGSGEVALHGEAPLYTVNISGSGKAAAFDLQSKNVTVNLSGSGVAEVNASEALAADISGSGVVYYLGNPAVTTNISGSGKVVKR